MWDCSQGLCMGMLSISAQNTFLFFGFSGLVIDFVFFSEFIVFSLFVEGFNCLWFCKSDFCVLHSTFHAALVVFNMSWVVQMYFGLHRSTMFCLCRTQRMCVCGGGDAWDWSPSKWIFWFHSCMLVCAVNKKPRGQTRSLSTSWSLFVY